MIFQRLVMAIKKALGWSDETKLIAANLDGANYDRLGNSVASDADGSVVVIGCQLDDAPTSQSGSVYVYSGTDNNTITKLTGSDITSSDFFGRSVAVSENGSIIVVGAENGNGSVASSGAVYVYSGANWATETKLEASDGAGGDGFGVSVAVSSDGITIVVGSYQDDDTFASTGSVYVYNGTTWGTQTKLNASDAAASDEFGFCVDISDDASTIVVGSLASESVYVLTGASWATEQIITASDGAAGDVFGNSVSISGDGTVIASGAPYDDDTFTDSGSVYIFSGASFATETKLNASDVTSADDYFGISVSLSDDGITVAVGAYLYDNANGVNAGSVYIYNGTTWGTETRIIASDGFSADYFGRSVYISDDGSTVVSGSAENDNDNGSQAGAAYIYSGTSWVDEKKLIARFNTAGDKYGYATAISGDGTVAVVGAYEDSDFEGAVYVYSGTDFATETVLRASDGAGSIDRFGAAVSANEDGSIVVVGATYEGIGGAIYVYSGAGLATETKIIADTPNSSGQFGGAVDITNDGTVIAVGAWNASGGGKVYALSGTNWATEQIILSSDRAINDRLGISVSISDDGTTIVAGASGDDDTFAVSGSAYIFSGTSYGTETKLNASDVASGDTEFGYSVSISGDGASVIVGARYYDPSATNSGAAYVYSGASWATETKLEASDGAANTYFGESASISNNGSIITIGSPDYSGGATAAGAVYAYSGTSWGSEAILKTSDRSIGDRIGKSVSISDNGKKIISGAYLNDDNGTNAGAAYIFEDI